MRGKSRQTDEDDATDTLVSSIDREAAILRLGSDYRYDLESMFESLASDPDPLVKSASLTVLLVYWGRTGWTKDALLWLHPTQYDSIASYRAQADLGESIVGAMSSVHRALGSNGPLKKEVSNSVVAHLVYQDESYVHRAAYLALLEMAGERGVSERVPDDFIVGKHVDRLRLSNLS